MYGSNTFPCLLSNTHACSGLVRATFFHFYVFLHFYFTVKTLRKNVSGFYRKISTPGCCWVGEKTTTGHGARPSPVHLVSTSCRASGVARTATSECRRIIVAPMKLFATESVDNEVRGVRGCCCWLLALAQAECCSPFPSKFCLELAVPFEYLYLLLLYTPPIVSSDCAYTKPHRSIIFFGATNR